MTAVCIFNNVFSAENLTAFKKEKRKEKQKKKNNSRQKQLKQLTIQRCDI